MKYAAIILALCVTGALADAYMMVPYGSNDRNCENNVNRNNGNRLFDSQNNAKGGYACPRAVGGANVVTPKMSYYVGSQLPVTWTNQHGNGANAKVDGQIILQYACEDTLDPNGSLRAGTVVAAPRDGIPNNANDAATDTIPANAQSQTPNNGARLRFGMHEAFDAGQGNYLQCQYTQRNKGLYTADQNVNRNDARGTRQNPNGNRNGLECPEERDYYPYWRPNGWRDVAVLVRDAKDCEARQYAKLSQNVDAKGVCLPTSGNLNDIKAANRQWPNNAKDCAARADATWKTMRFYEGFTATVPAPECKEGGYSRVNQLGNSVGNVMKAAEGSMIDEAQNNRYLWTIPDNVNNNCVLRMRYNISNNIGTLDAWDPALNSTLNGNNSPMKQDPYVSLSATDNKKFVSLAVNTNQFARTFQDRSYVFQIVARPAGLVGATCLAGAPCIMNVANTGKRGNIVQTYPATEYRFSPEDLRVKVNDAVHWQWTGSDYGPRRGCNNGEGAALRTDGNVNQNQRANRVNAVFQNNPADQAPMDMRQAAQLAAGSPVTPEVAMKLAFLDQPRERCLTEQQLNNLNAGNQRENNPRNCAKLNHTPNGYFNAEPQIMTKEGTFKYMSTRNNNFSNRGQGSSLTVGTTPSAPIATPGAPVFQLPGEVAENEKIGTQEPLGPETTAPQDKDNDSVGDGEKDGCEDMFWSALRGLGAFGAAALGVGMFSIGVGAALLYVWFTRRNSGAGRTDAAWMS